MGNQVSLANSDRTFIPQAINESQSYGKLETIAKIGAAVGIVGLAGTVLAMHFLHPASLSLHNVLHYGGISAGLTGGCALAAFVFQRIKTEADHYLSGGNLDKCYQLLKEYSQDQEKLVNRLQPNVATEMLKRLDADFERKDNSIDPLLHTFANQPELIVANLGVISDDLLAKFKEVHGQNGQNRQEIDARIVKHLTEIKDTRLNSPDFEKELVAHFGPPPNGEKVWDFYDTKFGGDAGAKMAWNVLKQRKTAQVFNHRIFT